MNIKTYWNYDDNNKLNKSPVAVESSVPCILKDNTELINPTLFLTYRMDSSTPPAPANFNYFYMPDFGRYYFVTSRTYSQQYLVIKGHVDPLYSFASAISDCKVVANRSSSRFDLFLNDPDLLVRADSYVNTKAFPFGFTAEGSEEFILAVTGGYQSTP